VFVSYTWADDALDGAGVVEEEAWKIRDTELVPVYPELWINVYPGHLGAQWDNTRENADYCARPDRVGVVHLAADGTLTLHPCVPCGVSGDVRGAA
jgi:hypothetical protein